jgi:hypothetical protein
MALFAEYSKKEFLQTAAGAASFFIIAYLTMLGIMVVIS